jgi:hypothetical protein
MSSSGIDTPVNSLASPGEQRIASVIGSDPGPTLLIVGGIRGNKPAGVVADGEWSPAFWSTVLVHDSLQR